MLGSRSLYSLFVGDLFPLFCAMAFAEVMGLIYTLIYIYHTQQRKQAFKTVAIAAVPISLLTLYAVLAWTDVIPQSNAVTGKVLGYMGITTSCLFFASPLVKMRTVIRTRSAACIIAPLCITGGIGNALWIVTSAVAGDMFVLVPNSICLVLNSIQVFLAVKYDPSKSKCPVDEGLAISIEVPVKAGELDNPVYYALQSPANIQVSELRP